MPEPIAAQIDVLENAPETIWVRAPHGLSPLQQVAEFWRRRELLGFLITYGLGRLYSKTLLGTAWLFIRPGIMIAGAVLVVGKMLGVATGPVPLVLFTLASFAPWLLFQRGLVIGTRSLSMYKALLNRFVLPRAMLHIASIAPAVLIFLLVFATAIMAMVYLAVTGTYTITMGWHTLWVPVALLLMMFLTWGLGFFTAPLNVMAGDTKITVRYLLTVTMIVSPVFYPIVQLSESVRSYMWYNPIACILELYRWGLFHQHEPLWWHIWLSIGMILGIFIAGWWFFSWCEQRALEMI